MSNTSHPRKTDPFYLFFFLSSLYVVGIDMTPKSFKKHEWVLLGFSLLSQLNL